MPLTTEKGHFGRVVSCNSYRRLLVSFHRVGRKNAGNPGPRPVHKDNAAVTGFGTGLCKDYAFGDLSGMSFKNVRLTIPAGENTASGGALSPALPAAGSSALGDLLFAERKLSGPVILTTPPHGGGREVSDRIFG